METRNEVEFRGGRLIANICGVDSSKDGIWEAEKSEKSQANIADEVRD
jgi:hypothetical protein